ncbi:MAG: DsbA family protein [Hyphomicrobiales bacterium]|nr:DsbA family protein [Hyphomicrobiales bacterium]
MRSSNASRRAFLAATAALVAAGGARAQTAAPAETVPMMKLMAPAPLPDIVEGKADAPVTVIEYASMTCPHCARFHNDVYPAFKAKYVDTGKAKFILREFPLDPLATAGFMLARCQGPAKRDARVDLLFEKQDQWAYVDKPIEALQGLVKQAGVSQSDFETCLKNQDLLTQVNGLRDAAGKDLNIDATPTFFFNGVKHTGEVSLDEMDKIIAPMLKS